MAKEEEKDDVTKDFDSVNAQAERLGLKGEERKDYIHSHMTGFGYRAKRTYYKPEDDEEKKKPPWARGKGNSKDDDDDF